MRKNILYLFIFVVLFGFVYRDLLLNITTALPDFRDYALIVWIMLQNIGKIISLDFYNFFNTSNFYPHPYALLFSDILLPQSILGLPIFVIFKNPILSFNLVFILTFVLNYFSSYLFWNKIFKSQLLAFFGSIFIIFSPFFHLEHSHFQMMSYWPFFFSLYFLIKTEEGSEYKHAAASGFFLAVQFLASVYLSVYLLACIAIIFGLRFLNKKDFRGNLYSLSILGIVFLMICGVFIKGYVDMKHTYNIKRDIKEYITYSANLSDYIFTKPVSSVIHNSSIINKWDGANKSNWSGQAAFPGILIFSLSLIGLLLYKKDKNTFALILSLDKTRAFFLITAIIGFVFSLGPRLVFNGTYAHIPLPYTIALDFFPLFEATRVPARWSYLFYFGLVFFALVGLQKISNNKFKSLILAFCFTFFIFEYIPLNIKASSEKYYDDRDLYLQSLCQDKKEVVLELPVTHMDAENDIASGLSYITKAQLASSLHKCFLINGYSGYDLPSLINLSQEINSAIDQGDNQLFYNIVKGSGATIVKFNPEQFPDSRQKNLQILLNKISDEDKFKELQGTIYSVSY